MPVKYILPIRNIITVFLDKFPSQVDTLSCQAFLVPRYLYFIY